MIKCDDSRAFGNLSIQFPGVFSLDGKLASTSNGDLEFIGTINGVIGGSQSFHANWKIICMDPYIFFTMEFGNDERNNITLLINCTIVNLKCKFKNTK